MNKTIIINIGNSIIHIEEEGYEILMAYLNDIKKHFAKTADDFEIVKDIENRIAEMFAERLQEGQKQVIEVSDVSAVITQMGSVKDFTDEEMGEESEAIPNYANYHGVKKLYRDTDDGVVAGVCAGLGHYLNVEARWLRLAVFLLVFFAGTGILVYLILWVAMPRAKNRSERMEMKGEATNLYGYKKSFDDELALIKRNMQSANKEMKPLVSGLGSIFAAIFKAFGNIINFCAKLLGKTFAWFVIVFGFGFMVTLVIMLGLLLGAWDGSVYGAFPFNIINGPYKNELVFASFFTLFIPVLALVLLGVKLIFSHVQISKYFSFLMLGVWIIAAVTTGFNVAKVVSAFNEQAEIVKTVDVKPYNRYIFKVDPNMVFSKEDSVKYNLSANGNGYRVVMDKSSHKMFSDPKNVRLIFEKTDDKRVTITESFRSNGKSFEDALANSQNLFYKYSITDSVISLTPRATLKRATAWRDQEVVLTVKIPVGTEVVLNNTLYDFLGFYYYCYHDGKSYDDSNEVWVMTADGLKCKYELEHPKEENKNE